MPAPVNRSGTSAFTVLLSPMALQIHTAPPDAHGKAQLGKTLVDLLDTAVERHPNPRAFNTANASGGWDATSNADMQRAVNELAAGLLEHGLTRGEHLAFFLDSDFLFSLSDLGSLLAGLVSVPLYVTFSRENLVYITQHSESKALIVSDPDRLAQFAEWASEVPDIRLVVLASGDAPAHAGLPGGVTLATMDDLRQKGRDAIAATPNLPDELRDRIDPSDLATLIYTSGTTGQPKGVMLSHENVSFNGISAISGYTQLGHTEEHVITFLPMTHIYARALQFASLGLGHCIYYSDPDHLVAHLPTVRPTMFATVPRVLEKVFDKVMLGIAEAEGAKQKIGAWAMGLATNYDLSNPPSGLGALPYKLADKLVYSKLRERLGLTRVKVVSVGGAALRADLANAFSAMNIQCFQGYGLTETSPVITAEIPGHRGAGTVGPPMAAVEVTIASDGEILTRGPHVMQGYYKNAEATDEVMDAEGWFHTGDIGEFTPAGLLRITDRKKALFKLSTGKYVIPQPMENKLQESALVEQAVVVGNAQKYAGAILFPGIDAVRAWGKTHGVNAGGDAAALLADPKVLAEFERVVAHANEGEDHWQQVKRFFLAPEAMTVENDLLTPKMSVKRSDVNKRYSTQIEALYSADVKPAAHGANAVTV